MMREIRSHVVNGWYQPLKIEVLDEPGPGGVFHQYRIVDRDTRNKPSGDIDLPCFIGFHEGQIKEDDVVTGVTNESLLAILEDRLICLQSGSLHCRENAVALQKIQEAMYWIQKRTRDRVASR